MNKRGFVAGPVIGLVCLYAVVAGTFDFATTNGRISSVKVNDQTKKNGKVIWCKMQNKGEAFCNNLYK